MNKKQVIKYYGNQENVADAIGLRRAAIAHWPENAIPLARQAQLEIHSNGALKATKIPNYKKLGISEREYQANRVKETSTN